MQSVQESKQELEASIRYAENAISSAKATIESMEFRQEMAKKQYAEQTGLEKAQEEQIHKLMDESVELKNEITELKREVQRQQDLGQGYYDSMMTFKQQLEEAKTNMALLTDEAEFYKKSYTELEVAQGRGVPTMPVIPKAVAIAIFREGMQHGVESACTELEGQTIEVEESEYYGHFEVSFSKSIELDEELDLDWMRGKVGDYSEKFVIDALGNLCADKEFECRIHGVDDQETEENAN